MQTQTVSRLATRAGLRLERAPDDESGGRQFLLIDDATEKPLRDAAGPALFTVAEAVAECRMRVR